jgi:hypothetical protein
MMPHRFITKMKQKSEARYGANRTPSLPIMSTAMLLRTKP